ncbi:K(+)-transporting ATPase subunit F [Diaphorobacter caeni]|nr:K(+)-transporting ATPase subunit F [Diaphorobacter caeni]MBF5003972.1 K(+)-transporting ATPase subunit F [Diaphorobacter caeni]
MLWTLSWTDWIAIAAVVGLFAYLGYALVRPEKF